MAEENLRVEVVASWGGNPLMSTLWGGDRALVVGPGGRSWLALPPAVLARDHALLRPTAAGWVLCVPPEATLTTTGAGRAVAPDAFGARQVPLTRGTTAEVRLGAFRFFVRPSAAVRERTRRTAGSWRWTRWLAVAAVFHAVLLGLVAMSPPDASALNLDGSLAQRRHVQVSLAATERTPPPVEPARPSEGATGGSRSDAAGSRGGGQDATVAEASSPGPVRRHGRRAPVEVDASNVNRLGALAVLGGDALSFGDGRSPYTAGSAQVGPGGLANAARLALPAGPGWGALDMGHAGVGTCDPRRQDCGEGLVGVGELETHGGPGGHVAGLRDREERPAPRVRTPRADTLGALSREQVRRVVRRHVAEVRFCCEQGLQRRPDLEGRVAVRFIVGSDGVVRSAVLDRASTTVGDARVSSCVSQAVQRWTFPSAPGTTGVTYPFVLRSR
ncbi:MAG TPA: AgmX/PglI C-terminal domain-containing protein [Sandaracinaceae bacterium LLY-WYZ-13_1]|nr:AgmX/PglI C-terminal domain-containing protein [Sandaracinaceae bacterium LLY-WYZ-13_1]